MQEELECPKCRNNSINFYTGKCGNCGYYLSTPPKKIAEQHIEDIIIPYQLKKLSIKENDILRLVPILY